MKLKSPGVLALLLLVGTVIVPPAGAEEPLHQRIDALIAAAAGDWPIAARSSDAEFVRRVYLDLAGRIPTADEARTFLDDASADKRARLIDQLLAGPDYPRHMSRQLHIMLMERLGDDPEWARFLQKSFEANKPWDQMARDILHPDREDEDARGAAYFLTARLISEGAMADVDVPGLTRDVARLLVGKDLQCAQCHDHLSVEDYKQRDFQGLHAIFLNIKQDRGVKFPAVSEGLMVKKHDFMSVFIQEPEQTGPLVPGLGEIEIPQLPEDQQYKVPPDRKARTPGVPAFSPLAELAGGLAREENEVFRRNIANRLWFLMLGRGLVHPLDLHHSDNPASHPELLDELARQFATHHFDIKWLLKEIALSDTYQRSSVLAAGQEPPPRDRFVLAHQKRISAEQLLRSTLVATGELRNYLPEEAAGEEAGQQATEGLEKLREYFVKVFANPPREPEVEFEPSIAGTLFALNNPLILDLFQRRPGNLVDRLAQLPDEQAIDELFLAILSRRPTDADRADVRAVLEQAPDREVALGRIAWALWSSNEFFINH